MIQRASQLPNLLYNRIAQSLIIISVLFLKDISKASLTGTGEEFYAAIGVSAGVSILIVVLVVVLVIFMRRKNEKKKISKYI